MKSINELLILLKENFMEDVESEISPDGLCVHAMRIPNLTEEEYSLLIRYINTNRPKLRDPMFIDDLLHNCKMYWFHWTNYKPRIKWLDYHIQLTNKL